MSSALYPYATGDLLESRNTYFYTPYEGLRFLRAWRDSRDDVLSELPEPAISAPAAATLGVSNTADLDTAALLERILDKIEQSKPFSDNLDRLVQRFEVSKRVHEAYSAKWRPVDPGNYHDLSLYLRFAEVTEAAYVQARLLTYLNVLLKVIDTLAALRVQLDGESRSRLARLILCERAHVTGIEKAVQA